MSTHSATVVRVDGEFGPRNVVIYADDVIWLSDELMAEANADRPRITGDIEVDGDLISFGTPGEGLGRLTYRLIGRTNLYGWHVAKREEPSADALDGSRTDARTAVLYWDDGHGLGRLRAAAQAVYDREYR